jgi:hypothetical protein
LQLNIDSGKTRPISIWQRSWSLGKNLFSSSVFAGFWGLIIVGGLIYGTYSYITVEKPVKNEDFPSGIVIQDYGEYDALETPNYSSKFDKARKRLQREISENLVVVDISEQKEYLFNKDGKLLSIYKVSTGSSDPVRTEVCVENDEGEEECEDEWDDRQMTPSVWKIRNKLSGEFAPLYGPRIMMLDKRVGETWMTTQVALHGTNQPDMLGVPSSLGCIYHKNVDIIELFEILEVGDYVVAVE